MSWNSAKVEIPNNLAFNKHKFPSKPVLSKLFRYSSIYSFVCTLFISLGMENDGNGNSCTDRNKIMNSKSGYGGGAYAWSACSVDFLQKFLR